MNEGCDSSKSIGGNNSIGNCPRITGAAFRISLRTGWHPKKKPRIPGIITGFNPCNPRESAVGDGKSAVRS